jgi:hypothetical protein
MRAYRFYGREKLALGQQSLNESPVYEFCPVTTSILVSGLLLTGVDVFSVVRLISGGGTIVE